MDQTGSNPKSFQFFNFFIWENLNHKSHYFFKNLIGKNFSKNFSEKLHKSSKATFKKIPYLRIPVF